MHKHAHLGSSYPTGIIGTYIIIYEYVLYIL